MLVNQSCTYKKYIQVFLGWNTQAKRYERTIYSTIGIVPINSDDTKFYGSTTKNT